MVKATYHNERHHRQCVVDGIPQQTPGGKSHDLQGGRQTGNRLSGSSNKMVLLWPALVLHEDPERRGRKGVFTLSTSVEFSVFLASGKLNTDLHMFVA